MEVSKKYFVPLAARAIDSASLRHLFPHVSRVRDRRGSAHHSVREEIAALVPPPLCNLEAASCRPARRPRLYRLAGELSHPIVQSRGHWPRDPHPAGGAAAGPAPPPAPLSLGGRAPPPTLCAG